MICDTWVRTQGPRDVVWVRPIKDILVNAIKGVELEIWQSSYHLRNSLKITCCSEVSDKGVVDEVEHTLDLLQGSNKTTIDGD